MWRKILLVVVGALLGLLAGLFFGAFQFHSPPLAVREPAAPGESRLTYRPPDPPRFSLEMLGQSLPMLKTMLSGKLIQVTPDAYLARGYGMGSVGLVVTSEGLVIIDSSDSPKAARDALEAIRKVTDKPVHTVIYTHFHPDHTQGTEAFFSPGVQVIATRDFLTWIRYQNELLGEHHLRSRATQAGGIDLAHAFKLPVDRNPFRAIGERHPVVMPTVTFDREYDFTLGGKKFHLFHTWGETPDHLAVWLEDERTLFVGDLYYASFPNLSTPMLESRPVQGWIDSLDAFIALRPEHVIPGHTDPVSGTEALQTMLTNYRDAVRYVHDETVRSINAGKSVDEAVAGIQLPEHLAALPYLQQVYGRVAWSIRGLYRGYTGWYDGHGTGLNPLPPHIPARELLSLAGGADKVLERAIALQGVSEHQLCCELCDLVIRANPKDALAHRIKASSLHAQAYGFNNLNAFGFYRSSYSTEMAAAEK